MVCVDANVVIEIILDRRHAKACREFIEGTQEDMAISMLSLDMVMYYAESKKLDLAAVQEFVRTFLWLPILEVDADRAFKSFAGDDFEDALQISCAIREKCTQFVTLDVGLAKKYAKDMPITLLSRAR